MAVSAVIGIVAAGSAVYGGQQAHSSKRHAEHVAKEQKQDQMELQAQAKQEEVDTRTAQAQASMQARNRAVAASNSSTRQDVSTNMLGDVGSANTKKSTLLGL